MRDIRGIAKVYVAAVTEVHGCLFAARTGRARRDAVEYGPRGCLQRLHGNVRHLRMGMILMTKLDVVT